MKRRALFVPAIALVVASRHSFAQPVRKVRIGFLGSNADPVSLRAQVEPLRQALRELGWTEGQNLAPIEFRWSEGKHERFPALIDELLRLDLDLLVTTSPRPAMLAKEATKTLPIVAGQTPYFDLIVTGAKGLGAVGRFLLGSVSTRVVQHAHCSVLVVR